MPVPIAFQIFGPTASGKTALAIRVAKRVNGAIINADSRQFYCGMPLLAATPSPQEMESAPHELYDFLSPTEPFSVGDYLKAARTTAARVVEQGKTPIFVGGTGFYLQALDKGLTPLPVVPREYAMELLERAEEEGTEVLHTELKAVDEESANALNTSDKQRICRALAVYNVSGAPLSYWQKTARPQGALPYNFIKIGLAPPRETVLERQELRFDSIMEDGVLDEVKAFLAKWSDVDRNVLTLHGFRELRAYLNNELSFEEARERIIIQMRQYAKRQMTWLRNSYAPDAVLEAANDVDALDALLNKYGFESVAA